MPGPMDTYNRHRPAVRAVMNAARDGTLATDCDGEKLRAAEQAGLIEEVSGMLGPHWKLTPLGSELMTSY